MELRSRWKEDLEGKAVIWRRLEWVMSYGWRAFSSWYRQFAFWGNCFNLFFFFPSRSNEKEFNWLFSSLCLLSRSLNSTLAIHLFQFHWYLVGDGSKVEIFPSVPLNTLILTHTHRHISSLIRNLSPKNVLNFQYFLITQ